MEFQELISILSKSSPYAVKTEHQFGFSNELEKLKEYLYIESEIEKDFLGKLDKILSDKKKILFLCGSSGDGKSEILTKLSRKKEYLGKVIFHLDATHSFKPKETAIERLDILFSEYEENNKPLVIGINTGMLANYAQSGSKNYIKEIINNYLINDDGGDEKIVEFVDFKKYSNFKFEDDGYSLDFFNKFFIRLVEENKDNILYEKYIANENSKQNCLVNFKILKILGVKDVLIELLFSVRLMHDQFVTTRALLDFFYSLLSNDGYIFENLFNKKDNEIIAKISGFDPASIRTKMIDDFILSIKLGIISEEMGVFLEDIKKIGIKTDLLNDSNNLIRLFFLLKKSNFSNNFHKKFIKDLEYTELNDYKLLWLAHHDIEKNKKYLNKFYSEFLSKAINNYNSRNACVINAEEFLLDIRGGVKIIVEFDLIMNKNKIKGGDNIDYIVASILVNNKELNDFKVGINLLSLVNKIVKGYQPNKNDKNNIVLLDRLIDRIRAMVIEKGDLFLLDEGVKYKVKDLYDDGSEIKVSIM